MSSFQVLIKRDAEAAPPLWQEGCPLLVETWQISKNLSTNEVWLQLRIRNTSNQPVTASIVKFKGTGLNGKVNSRTFELPQTTLHPGFTFEFHPALLGNKEVNEASVFVESVELEDKSTWSNTKETNVVPIERKEISLDGKQAEARAKLLEEEGCTKSSQAKKYQFESHENWWLCACGQLNLGTEKCNACSIPKQETNAFEDLEQIEETRKQIEKAKVQRTKKNSKIAAALVAAVVVCGLIIVGIASMIHDFSTRSILNLAYLTNLSHDQSVSYLKEKSSTVSESDNVVSAWIKDEESNLGDEGNIDPKRVLYTFSENDHSMLYFTVKGADTSSLDDVHDAIVKKSGLNDIFFSGSDTEGSNKYYKKYYYDETKTYKVTAGRCKIDDKDAAWYVCSSGDEASRNGSSLSLLKGNASITIIVSKLNASGTYSSYESIKQKLLGMNLRDFVGFRLNKTLG